MIAIWDEKRKNIQFDSLEPPSANIQGGGGLLFTSGKLLQGTHCKSHKSLVSEMTFFFIWMLL